METNRPIIGPLKVTEIHSSGKGVAVWNEKKYFIPYTLPNEEYMVQTENRRLGFRTAKIISIEKQSEARVQPQCPYYGLCGGCNFMHIRYEEQLAIKRTILENAFEKYQVPFHEPNTISADEPFYYRNKATYQILYKNEVIQIGFHPEWLKNELIEIKTCLLLRPIINEYFNNISQAIRQFYYESQCADILSFTIRSNRQNNVMLIIEIKQEPSDVILSFFSQLKKTALKSNDAFYYFVKPQNKRIYPHAIHINDTVPYLFERILEKTLRISPFSFFQNNVEITEKILRYLIHTLDFEKIHTVFDLYSGNGTMSLPLIKDYEMELYAIEGNPSAIDDAIFNSANKENHHHILGDVLQTFTKEFVESAPHPNLIILDPPRSGTLIEIQKNIIKAKPEFIAYISCNPVSLAWNLQQLITDYQIKDVQLFDMFPQTHHFETVVILEKN